MSSGYEGYIDKVIIIIIIIIYYYYYYYFLMYLSGQKG